MAIEIIVIVRGDDYSAGTLADTELLRDWVCNDPYGKNIISAQEDISWFGNGPVMCVPRVEDPDKLYGMLRSLALTTGAQITAIEMGGNEKRLVEFTYDEVLGWYLDHPGHCPCCRSQNIEGGDWDDEFHIQQVRCLDCNRKWADTYKLAGVEFDERV